MSGRRVVVTGLGLVTPLGVGVEDTWTSLVAGRSAVTLLDLLGDGGEPRHLAAPVPPFNMRSYVPDRKLLRVMCRTDRFGLAAAQMAVADAGPVDLDSSRKAAFIATGKEAGPIENLFDAMRASRDDSGAMTSRLLGSQGLPHIPPLTLVAGLPNGCLFAVSVLHSINGANTCFLGSGTAGLVAIGAAYQAVREGEADWAIAGGHDTGVDRWSCANFHRLGMLSSRTHEPTRAVRPFDRRRDGFALGEGAAMVVLEERRQALARGASVWAEIVGYAATCDGAGMIKPAADGSALAAAIAGALRNASLQPADVDYLNAYASATTVGDLSELRGLHAVFGDSHKKPLVSGIKAATGHLLAASGAAEFAAAVLALHHQVAPPTLNLDEPDPECHFDCVPHQARPAAITTAVTISRGIGGQNSALVMRRPEGD
ncbi:MAG: beta-ketoacyl-[acyl-carrier-protein] synthase family protein [Armatimonadota bacterium]|nr:MAG: beta-ketoacyl-[acyl-carrier-protein] synthase family protein [Armatimonadota bacterium]